MHMQKSQSHLSMRPVNGFAATGPRERVEPVRLLGSGAKRHVLVPIRLEPAYREGVILALEMATVCHAVTVSLLHVLPPESEESASFHWLSAIDKIHKPESLVNGSTLSTIDRGRREIAKLIENDIPASLRTALEFRVECRIGEPAAEIARYANEQAVDVMLLASERSVCACPCGLASRTAS